MEQEGLSGQGSTSGRLGLKAGEVGLIPLVVYPDELGALVASAGTKKKAQLVAFAYSNSSKGRSSGVILVVASRFASVDTIPNAVRSRLLTKILLGSAPAELGANGLPNV